MSAQALEGTLDDASRAALFGTLTGVMDAYVSCIDHERRVVFINRTLSRDMSQILGRPLEEFIESSHRTKAIDEVEAAFASGQTREFEYVVQLADGARRHMCSRVVPLQRPAGSCAALMLTFDLTERRQLQEQLEHSLEFRRRVVEHLPDFVTLVDRERRYLWVNRLAPGLTLEDVLGTPFDRFVSEEAAPMVNAAVNAAFNSATVSQYEVEGYGDGVNKAWYLVRVVPVTVDNRVENILFITSDITERKRAEQALRQTEEQLQRAQRLESLGQLAGGIAHDFNNLLQVIGGNLAFAQQSLRRGDSAEEELDQALRATERAAELTSHLLTIGRRQRVDCKQVELAGLVEHSIRMLRRALPENITLTCDTPAEPYFVELDAPQFEQVLLNLCVNARDAMPRGGALTVRITADGPKHVLLSVSDTGSGIAAEALGRVFEPFFTTKRAGSGLGLAVAAGIVAAHGGVISAESDGVSGTTMKVRLPLVEPERARPTPSSKPPPPGSGVILVAEDEDLVRNQVVRTLERAGYTVLQAANGARAVELFKEHTAQIDRVLLDVVMPELDGWQAFLKMQSLKPNVKVLFTTGYAANVLPEDFASRGARLLSKPHMPQRLLTEIHALLQPSTAVGPQ